MFNSQKKDRINKKRPFYKKRYFSGNVISEFLS